MLGRGIFLKTNIRLIQVSKPYRYARKEYLLNEIKKYRTANTEESDCVYHISSGHDGDLDLSFVVLFDKKKDKYCGVKFAHPPVWNTDNELTIEYIVKE